MEPVISRQADGTVTISITLPPDTAGGSLLRMEEQIMEAVNAVGRAAMREVSPRFDDAGQSFVKDGRNWTTKGKVSKIYETAWGKSWWSAISIKPVRAGPPTILLKAKPASSAAPPPRSWPAALRTNMATATPAPWCAI